MSISESGFHSKSVPTAPCRDADENVVEDTLWCLWGAGGSLLSRGEDIRQQPGCFRLPDPEFHAQSAGFFHGNSKLS